MNKDFAIGRLCSPRFCVKLYCIHNLLANSWETLLLTRRIHIAPGRIYITCSAKARECSRSINELLQFCAPMQYEWLKFVLLSWLVWTCSKEQPRLSFYATKEKAFEYVYDIFQEKKCKLYFIAFKIVTLLQVLCITSMI